MEISNSPNNDELLNLETHTSYYINISTLSINKLIINKLKPIKIYMRLLESPICRITNSTKFEVKNGTIWRFYHEVYKLKILTKRSSEPAIEEGVWGDYRWMIQWAYNITGDIIMSWEVQKICEPVII